MLTVVENRAQEDAEESFDAFVAEFSPKYEKAVVCLARDRERLLSFLDFPAEHWKHLLPHVRAGVVFQNGRRVERNGHHEKEAA